MKKITDFAVMFVLHFAVSLIFNWVFGESENIGRMLMSSLLFVVIYTVFCRRLIEKIKDESEADRK